MGKRDHLDHLPEEMIRFNRRSTPMSLNTCKRMSRRHSLYPRQTREEGRMFLRDHTFTLNFGCSTKLLS